MSTDQIESHLSTSSHQYQTLGYRSFWRAGSHDYFPSSCHTRDENLAPSDLERARVHPKFLHSNATSHKWVFGAIAELLDNAVDEICNGATFVKVDRVFNCRDNSPALVFHDNGGGMDPGGIRQCMSLGFSSKKASKTIGQYGNGFKTSTMRLGADAIVFSCFNRGSHPTQSIGLLSYTYLMRSMKNDIIVPIVDFEIVDNQAVPLVFGSQDDWHSSLKTILDWSPFSSQDELLLQLKDIGSHGTKVLVYNLWHDDDGLLELDFNDDDEDIRLRDHGKSGGNLGSREEIIQSHISFLYRSSLRAYASILYLRKFTEFSIILRGKPVQQLDLAGELKFSKTVTYRPYTGKEASVKTTIGFAKEAPLLGIYGFNIYHKNRLIIPFWKVLQEGSARGRCVLGVLEANFIEPAHDKQDFERSPLFNRLETKLKQVILEYWKNHCHLIGYLSPYLEIRNKQNQSGKTSHAPQPGVLQNRDAVQPVQGFSSLQQQSPVDEPVVGVATNLQEDFAQVQPINFQKELPARPVTGVSELNACPASGYAVIPSVESFRAHGLRDSSAREGTSFEGSESIDFPDSSLIDKISEENVKLFLKREEYKGRQMELKHLIENLEEELSAVRTKCAKLASDIESQKQQIAGN